MGENIADIGGFKEARKAYDILQKKIGLEDRLPGLQNYTIEQLFWISGAQPWCGKFRPQALKNMILMDPHTPPEYRVNGALSDMPEFADDFKCDPGTPMNPINKCVFW